MVRKVREEKKGKRKKGRIDEVRDRVGMGDVEG